MKKKLLCLFIIISLLLSFMLFFVNAEELNSESSDVEIRFFLGDSTLLINNSSVSVPAPFTIEGTTMVPLRVISEAFGAVVDWNDNEKKVDIKYENSNISMNINNKTALFDGQAVELPVAPVIKNSVTMVPLRFISENFGATVGYDDRTKEITVNKEKNIDIASLLNVNDKSFVGDSYFKWSMKNSPSFSLVTRNFDGSFLIYTDESELNDIYITIYNNYPDDYTIEKAILDVKGIVSNETLVSQKQDKKDDADYYEIITKSKYNSTHRKVYWKNQKLYFFTAYIDNESEKKDADLAIELLNSVTLNYNDSNDILDLSNLDENGMRKFEQNNLKISMSFPADWEQVEDDNKINSFKFIQSTYIEEQNYPLTISVNMYSREDGQTLEDWVKKDSTITSELYNPDFFKITDISKKIGSYESKGYKGELKIGKNAVVFESYYIFGGKYKYQIYVVGEDKSYHEATESKIIENIISSFRFEEPNSSEIGLLTEDDPYEYEDKVTNDVKLDDYGISFKLPASWEVNSYGFYNNKDETMFLMVLASNNYLNSESESSIRNSLPEGAKFIGLSKNVLIAGKKATCLKFKSDDMIVEQYLITTSSNSYVTAYFRSQESFYSAKSKTIIKDILDSIKLI